MALTPVIVLQTVHFIRHGEGFHNIGYDGNLDAHLTPFGWTQAHALNNHIQTVQRPPDIQVLLLSPCSDAHKAIPLSFTMPCSLPFVLNPMYLADGYVTLSIDTASLSLLQPASHTTLGAHTPLMHQPSWFTSL